MDGTSADWRKSTYSGANGGTCVEVGTWRKSTYSGANGGTCVEVGTWRKSTYSGSNGGQCVEVGAATPGVVVRDTTDRAGAVLAIPARAWRTLLAEIRA
jgi:Domain of unknown function (DUF397)